MRKELEKKIEELFVYRRFPQLFDLVGENYKNHPIISALKELQIAIYFLDHHLETNWTIDPEKDLKKYWKEIYRSLTNCGVDQKVHDDYCKLIYRYQKHELYLRQNKLPTSLNIEHYYYFKSCDVKLLRRIISDKFPMIKRLHPPADWRYFDLITEVNDDVEDVFEDGFTINGNYFLIDHLKNGIDKAQENMNGFIEQIARKNSERLKLKKGSYKWCGEMTQTECIKTQKLLKKNSSLLKKDTRTTEIERHLNFRA